MKPEWASNVITAFARFGGQPVGIVASQPKVLGGTLDVNSADKAARFVWLCDAFGIPLVFLQDVPGFIVGSAVEKQGIIRHGAKMLFAVSEATVPKVTVVLRKAYGAGYFVMNGTAYEADYIVAWPTAEIAVMGPDGMVNIIMRKQLDAIPEGKERDEARIAMAEELRKNIDPYIAAGHAAGRRHHRPGRDPPRHLQGPAGVTHQGRRAALAQARRAARLSRRTRRFMAERLAVVGAGCRAIAAVVGALEQGAQVVGGGEAGLEQPQLELDLGVAGGDDRQALGLGRRVVGAGHELVGLELEDAGQEGHGALAGHAHAGLEVGDGHREMPRRSASSCWVQPSSARSLAMRRPNAPAPSHCQLA